MKYDFQQQLIESIISNSQNKLDEFIIRGLKLKGFEFTDRLELEKFIKLNCECIDSLEYKQKTYYVFGKPFLLYDYKSSYEPIFEIDNGIKMSCTLGAFYFL